VTLAVNFNFYFSIILIISTYDLSVSHLSFDRILGKLLLNECTHFNGLKRNSGSELYMEACTVHCTKLNNKKFGVFYFDIG